MIRVAALIFGTESRWRPLVWTLFVVTSVRFGWLAINADPRAHASLFWALVPWPPHRLSRVVWAVDIGLVLYQLRAALGLVRQLLLRFAPDRFGFLDFNASRTAGQPVRPRNRSWLPTALLLSGTLILTCCAVPWLIARFNDTSRATFDLYMTTDPAITALLVGLGLSLLGLMAGSRHIARGANEVSSSFGVVAVNDHHWLAQRIHAIADTLNLPRPAVGVTNVVNAFAMGANQKSSMVVIGKPLFALEPDELDAIIGHELGHILHNDVARIQFAEGFQRMLVTVVNVLMVIVAIVAAAASKKQGDAQRNMQLAFGSGVIVRSTVFFASELVAKGISRNREFHADAVGAYVTSPDAMARALKRIHGVADKPTAEERHYGYLMFRSAGFGSFFATHPSLRARLAALDAHSTASPNATRRAPA